MDGKKYELGLGLSAETLRYAKSLQEKLLSKSGVKRVRDDDTSKSEPGIDKESASLKGSAATILAASGTAEEPSSKAIELQPDSVRPKLEDSEAMVNSVIGSQTCGWCNDYSVAMDVFIRAHLFGWDQLHHITANCQWWDGWRKVDTLYEALGARRLERFTFLFCVLCLIANHFEGGLRPGYNEVTPSYLRPRPFQYEFGAGDRINNYPVWPGARGLIHRQGGDKSQRWQLLEAMLRDTWFYWPHTLEHAFEFDETRSLFCLNDDFTAHLHELQSWRAGDDFLRRFPAFENVCYPLSKLQEHVILFRMGRSRQEREQIDVKKPVRKRQRIIEGNISLRVEELD